MTQLIESWRGSAALAASLSGDGLPLDSVALLAPLPSPGAVLCVGKNYADHVKVMDAAPFGSLTRASVPAAPIIFTKAPACVVAHGAPLVLPPPGVSTQVDYEGELGVVIGRGGFCIARADAAAHVFGYTVLNDVSARDLQKKHQQVRTCMRCAAAASRVLTRALPARSGTSRRAARRFARWGPQSSPPTRSTRRAASRCAPG